MRVIVTRPSPDGEDLAAKLAAMGHQPVIMPVMGINWLDNVPWPDNLVFDYVVFTSANGARALRKHDQAKALTSATAITIGPASTSAARKIGFDDIIETGGNLATVTACLSGAGVSNPEKTRVLYISGVKTSGDLAADLSKIGFEVVQLVLYDAVAGNAISDEGIAAIKSGSCDGVTLHSSRSAALWAAMCLQTGLLQPAIKLSYFCLSVAIAKAIKQHLDPKVRVFTAEEPTENSFLALF